MSRFCRLIQILTLVAAAGAISTPRAQAGDLFEPVALLFEQKCVNCHREGQREGGLSLETAQTALAGGDSGAVIDPGHPEFSLLVDHISGDEPVMPKRGAKLTAEQVGAIRAWITGGANWPAERKLTDKFFVDQNWWSLAPLVRPAIPQLNAEDAARVRTPVDAFILAKLREHHLAPSPEADRRTLIRRLAFDLIGLPPSYEQVEAFARDPDPRAYEKLVDRLLDSPAYGERWARHWLDVVHYGDTHGYDKDKVRLHAWPYRDYVIRAFNEDKPYARFIKEQLAGDVLYPHTRDGIEGLGFLSAGPWDYVGHAELGEEKLDGQIARMLDRDDMVSTTMNVFVSATVQCARCHNHKFDPISTDNYYGLQAVFAAIDRADRPYDTDPQVAKQRGRLMEQVKAAEGALAKAQAEVARIVGGKLAPLDSQIAALTQKQTANNHAEFGYHSGIEKSQDAVKWVQIALPKETALSRVVLVGCHDPYNGIGAGFGFPVRFRVEASNDPEFRAGVTLVADHTAEDFTNPKVAPVTFSARDVKAKYLRVTATKLAPRSHDYIFALGELLAFDHQDQNVARGAGVTSLDSIEAPVRWRRSNLTDGLTYQTWSAADVANLAALQAERTKIWQTSLTDELQEQLLAAEQQLVATQAALANLPAQQQIYCGTIHTGSGAFRGTGPSGAPRAIFVLARGDLRSPVKPAAPGALPYIAGVPAAFTLNEQHTEGERRAALAKWISDDRNPLTWRSIVNRVWLYHFGRGIVDSPNDFGRMGEQPTHPELLAWLACEFRDEGQSLKQLQRLIVNSAAYRQQTAHNAEATKVDAANQYYWRQNRRRLEAEAVHDATLLVAGKLDRRMYGPGYRSFGFKDDHSPRYEYDQHDPDDSASHRRSIYRFIVRSVPDPFLETLDCADPSAIVAKRNETLTPLQALALLNNKFMIRMSAHFADRVAQQGESEEEQIATAFRLALGREPQPNEQAVLVEIAREHGLANACRVLLNSNEFLFVD
jgi:hypothetical protein